MPSLTVRETTKEKLERIADRKRWTLAETVDALCDEHEEREVPSPNIATSRQVVLSPTKPSKPSKP